MLLVLFSIFFFSLHKIVDQEWALCSDPTAQIVRFQEPIKRRAHSKSNFGPIVISIKLAYRAFLPQRSP